MAALEDRVARLEAMVAPSEGTVAFSGQPDGWTFGATIGPDRDVREALRAAAAALADQHEAHAEEILSAFKAAEWLADVVVAAGVPTVVSAYGHRQGEGYALNVAVHVPPTVPEE